MCEWGQSRSLHDCFKKRTSKKRLRETEQKIIHTHTHFSALIASNTQLLRELQDIKTRHAAEVLQLHRNFELLQSGVAELNQLRPQ